MAGDSRNMKLAVQASAGMNQDMAKSDPKRAGFYYEANNVTIAFNQDTGQLVVQNEQGNKAIFSTLPNIHISHTTDSTFRDNAAWTAANPNTIFTETSLPPNHVGRIVTTYNTLLTSWSFNSTTFASDVIQYSYIDTAVTLDDLGITTGLSGYCTNHEIIGLTAVRDISVIFSTNGSWDAVWTLTYDEELSPTLTLVWTGDLNFSQSNPIQAVPGYESDKIQKVYWVDGKRNPLRMLNFGTDSPHNEFATNLDHIPKVDFVQIGIEGSIPGGTLPSGIHQYTFHYYNKNGVQTNLAPYSFGAAAVNQERGLKPEKKDGNSIKLKISAIDTRFDYLRVYRISYDNLTNTPKVSMVADTPITDDTVYEFVDSGSTIAASSVSELEEIGGTLYYPNTLEVYEDRLFIANVDETATTIDYDTRAYCYPDGITHTWITDRTGTSYRVNNAFQIDREDGVVVTGYNVPDDHDAVGIWQVPTSQTIAGTYSATPTDYWSAGNASTWLASDIRKARNQSDGTTLGAEGINVTLEWAEKTLSRDVYKTSKAHQFRTYKSNEYYRFGVEFYDDRGNTIETKWIGDFRCPSIERYNGKDERNYDLMAGSYPIAVYPKFTFANLGGLPSNVKGLRVVRAKREDADKSILTQGVANPILYHKGVGITDFADVLSPMITLRENILSGTTPGIYTNWNFHGIDLVNGGTISGSTANNNIYADMELGNYIQRFDYFNMYSPEALFGDLSFSTDCRIRYLGHAEMSACRTKLLGYDGGSTGEPASSGTTYSTDDIGNTNRPLIRFGGSISGTLDDTVIEGGNSKFGNRHRAISQFMSTLSSELTASTTSTLLESADLSDIKIVETNEMGVDIDVNSTDDEEYHNRIEIRDHAGNAGFFGKKDERKDVVAKHIRCIIGRAFTGGGSSDNFTAGLISASARASSGTTARYPVGEIIRKNANRYGGWYYDNRQGTAYIDAGTYVPITKSSHATTVRNGDTFINQFRFNRVIWETSGTMDPEQPNAPNITITYKKGTAIANDEDYKPLTYSEWISVPLESTMNMDLRADKSANILASFEMDYDDYHVYNEVYHREMDYRRSFPRAFQLNEITTFDNVTSYSDSKVPNELLDNWCQFKVNNRKFADGPLGAISGLYRVQDKLYVTQSYGCGVWIVSPNAAISTTAGEVVLGTGAVLQGYIVMSNKNGTSHRFGACKGRNNVYFLDVDDMKLVVMSGSGHQTISDAKGAFNILRERISEHSVTVGSTLDQQGVVMGYDPNTYNIYMTVFSDYHTETVGEKSSTWSSTDKSFTLSYNEITQSFVSFHDYRPGLYYSDQRIFFSTGNESATPTRQYGLWMHNKGPGHGNYYGTDFDSYITYLVNSDPMHNKQFYNLEYRLEVYDGAGATYENGNFKSYRMWNANQDTGTVSLTTGNRRTHKHQRKWRINVGRDTLSRRTSQRITNEWSFLRFDIDNSIYSGSYNYRFVLHDLVYSYSFSLF